MDAYRCVRAEVRQQLGGINPLLLPPGSWGSNSGIRTGSEFLNMLSHLAGPDLSEGALLAPAAPRTGVGMGVYRPES